MVLETAANENRILISHDRRIMPHHFARFILEQASPGIFIVSQSARISRLIDDIILVWSASDSDEWVNIISELPFR